MSRITNCTNCHKPIITVTDETTGNQTTIDLKPIDGGAYELLQQKIIRRRYTRKGNPQKSGKGYRKHTCLTSIGTPPQQQTTPTPPPQQPKQPEPTPAILIELEPLLGKQNTQTQEWDGPLGETTCGKCGQKIIAAKHHKTGNTVLLNHQPHPNGQWRAYKKNNQPLAEYRDHKDPHANRINHRLLCEEAHS